MRTYRVNEYSVRLVRDGTFASPVSMVHSPADIANFATLLVGDCDKEHIIVIFLSTRMKIIGYHTVSIGSLNEAIVSIPEILRAVILSGTSFFAIVHNHPGGDASPSHNDINATRKIFNSATMIGLEFVDHVIVTSEPGRYYSMKERGIGGL